MLDTLSYLALPPLSLLWMGPATRLAAQEPANNNPFNWIWVLIALLLLIPLVWWLRRSSEPETSPRSERGTPHVEGEPMEHVPAAKVPMVEAITETEEPVKQVYSATRSPHAVAIESAPPDDLVIIEGIGPKISALLQANGINTFGQLAAIDISRVEQLLEEAGFKNIANPATWSEQARLASEGKWDELKALQAELKGGRRK